MTNEEMKVKQLKSVHEAVDTFFSKSIECDSANITEVAIRANSYIDNFLDQHYDLNRDEKKIIEDVQDTFIQAKNNFDFNCECTAKKSAKMSRNI